MRPHLFLVAAALLAGPAAAQPLQPNPPNKTVQCIETGGQIVPVVCQAPASRLDLREYICTCPNGGQRVEVAICGKGETPPPEGKTLNIARATAARDGSLLGDTVGGKPICVAGRRP